MRISIGFGKRLATHFLSTSKLIAEKIELWSQTKDHRVVKFAKIWKACNYRYCSYATRTKKAAIKRRFLTFLDTKLCSEDLVTKIRIGETNEIFRNSH
ncbi:hypothetical protein BC469_08070 [Vibrio parahaemolyticus]|nr:hypothetical protein [Vibrio parahaemolyticus]OQS99734.1 hypothetical protein EM58_014810 [Vibrio parahaemolyticus 98-513-F52]OXD53953.1 hypothetical protein CA153_19125 [Vibrio parahaemolyticus]